MCTLEKLNCKISRGSMPPDSPSLLAPSALDFIWAGLTLNCFRQAGYFQLVTLTMILRILRTQEDVSFLSRKGCTKGLLTRDPLKLKVHPPPPRRKSCVRACMSALVTHVSPCFLYYPSCQHLIFYIDDNVNEADGGRI